MRILGLYSEDFPWDVRIEKILGGLATAGHQVDLVCRKVKSTDDVEQVGGIRCHRVSGNLGQGFGSNFLSTPAPFNPLWRRVVSHLFDHNPPDLIIVRDIPLSPLALDFGRMKSCPVIVDMAENHPAMWRNQLVGKWNKAPSFIMKNPRVAEAFERRVVREANGIFVVVEEMKDRLVGMGADPDLVHIVSNTPRLDEWRIPPAPPRGSPAPKTESDRLNVVFVGLVSRVRGLETMLRAMKVLRSDPEPRPLFHIVGSGAYVQHVKEVARDLGVLDDVVFHGWVDHSDLPALVSSCDVGIIPHLVNDHTNTTIPNKIFDFMALQLPVLVSSAAPMARIVDDTGCGLVFRGEDGIDLARRLGELGDPVKRSTMGEKGRNAVHRTYNWEQSFSTVVRVTESLVRRD